MAKKAAPKKVIAQLVVQSKVKELIKSEDCQMAGDTIEALNEKVGDLIQAAIKRTKDNKRVTVKPVDL